MGLMLTFPGIARIAYNTVHPQLCLRCWVQINEKFILEESIDAKEKSAFRKPVGYCSVVGKSRLCPNEATGRRHQRETPSQPGCGATPLRQGLRKNPGRSAGQ